MPISVSRSAGCIVACAVALAFPALAGAAKFKTVGSGLRVVGPQGQTLAQQVQYTGTAEIPTDPNATCFGQGTGGSGAKVKVPGPTALGQVQDASKAARDLQPLSVTDAFEFGLGVCGIGGFVTSGSSSWYVKSNHVGSQVGADQIVVGKNDEILWYLAPSFPYPSELELEAPQSTMPNSDVQVTAFAYDDAGKQSPAAGATVTGGSAPVTTDAQGNATVPVGSKDVTLQATSGSLIPSEAFELCVAEDARDCSPQNLVEGTGKRDKVFGTPVADRIKARAADDVVKARGGGPDTINCGKGRRDVAFVKEDDVTRACEKVKQA
jgi:hypothetical protein